MGCFRKMATTMGRGFVLLKFLGRNSPINNQCHVQTKLLSTSSAFQAKQMTVRDALNQAIDEEIARDERVFMMGEESLNTTELTRSPAAFGKNGATKESLTLPSRKWVSRVWPSEQ